MSCVATTTSSRSRGRSWCARIHRAYLEAGADIIETNTFNSNAVSQADYGTRRWFPSSTTAPRAWRARAADECAAGSGSARFVAGALGPTNRMSSMSPDVNDPGYRSRHASMSSWKATAKPRAAWCSVARTSC